MESPWHLLPADLIELQIGQIDLLLAMYPDETMIEEDSKGVLDILRDVTTTSDTEKAEAVVKSTPSISVLLDLPISLEGEDEEEMDSSRNPAAKRLLRMDLGIPFAYQGNSTPLDAPNVKVRVQQPNWMSKAATAQLTSCNNNNNNSSSDADADSDLLSTIDSIREKARAHLSSTLKQEHDTHNANGNQQKQQLVRVFFYFPSISTRSKRTDLITLAPVYRLTGFLFAGKPGLLCVEGTSTDIDAYMRYIKTESWGDIPAHHKKVSERYREECGGRVFEDMREITDVVGERRGTRANRGDMKAVEEWLVERGLGEAFAKVLM
ncbi:uncharacterized protein SETTUDRAFT_92906 [Exserohilum turcica Et28A]|uniref:Small nuclear ribonucleoprotein Prp3 C-terminal domain-containing protein n=1 Tax=Exserohilum turcicum (strain 28A) TaxID=671987 RepID=R0K3S3_EXST2|nr:uncharacterized protein SETTUDRAFT_92906 [Exserohilum turcica Et28A]EOA84214.1 hypothetical protein SETTUDRAFT_92906 [Exserohilum turcica Et28A]